MYMCRLQNGYRKVKDSVGELKNSRRLYCRQRKRAEADIKVVHKEAAGMTCSQAMSDGVQLKCVSKM